MREFIGKVLILTIGVYMVVIGMNYVIDPANLFHLNLIDKMVSALTEGKIVEVRGDYSQGMLINGMLETLDEEPQTLILGSSQTMYLPWEENYDGVLVGGVSNAHLGDYYAVLGMVESQGYMPERVIIGVDPWAFYTDSLSGSPSIANYAQYERDKIEGKNVSLVQTASENRYESHSDKIKEMFSFPYFQSSVSNLELNGIDFYFHRDEQEVKIAEDDSVGEKIKLMPNCRMIMNLALFKTVEENNAVIQNKIDSGIIGTYLDGFTELPRENLGEFEDMVEYLQNNGVEVEFYLPACYPLVYEFFEISENFEGVFKLEQYIRKWAKSHEIIVHGSYNPELSGVVSEDFPDGGHLRADRMLDSYNTIVEFE